MCVCVCVCVCVCMKYFSYRMQKRFFTFLTSKLEYKHRFLIISLLQQGMMNQLKSVLKTSITVYRNGTNVFKRILN